VLPVRRSESRGMLNVSCCANERGVVIHSLTAVQMPQAELLEHFASTPAHFENASKDVENREMIRTP